MSAPAPRTRCPPGRRLLFISIIVLGEVGLVEVASRIAARRIEGEWTSLSESQARREGLLSGEPEGELLGNANDSWHRRHALHPYLGFVNKPDLSRRGADERLRRTDYGFLDDGPPLHQRSEEQVVIGLFGGSVAAQFRIMGVSELERELVRRRAFEGKTLRFVNLAAGGYKQPQQLLALQYVLALGGEFDLVINIDGYNEVALHPVENAPKSVHIAFPRNWFVIATKGSDRMTFPLTQRMKLLREGREGWARKVTDSWLAHTSLGNLLWSMRDRSMRRDLNETRQALQDLVVPPQQAPFAARGPAQEFASQDAVEVEMVALWARCSRQMQGVCEANDMRYLHVLQPNQYVADSKPRMSDEERSRVLNDDHPYRESTIRGYPRLQRAGAEMAAAGVSFHDLTMLFRDVSEPTYSDDCCHLDPHGNELLAREIARLLDPAAE